jgi:hypothetical protein
MKSLIVLPDFDSPMRRFESSRPSQALRVPENFPSLDETRAGRPDQCQIAGVQIPAADRQARDAVNQ